MDRESIRAQASVILTRFWQLCFVVTVASFIGVVTARGEIALMTWDVSREGSDGLLFDPDLPGVVVFACLGSVAAGIVMLVPRFTRFWGFAALLAGPACLVTWHVPSFESPRSIRMEAFRSLGHRLMPVVYAIEEFEGTEHRLPRDLSELTPQYLPRLPSTGMGNYPVYEYSVLDGPNLWDSNPWVITVDAGLGFGDWDVL